MTPHRQLPNALVAGLVLGLAGTSAWAGRPLSTDDAGTANARSCFVEGWFTRVDGAHASTLAPACGVADGVELGADYTLPSPRDLLRASGGLAVKLAPAAWRHDTPHGELAFGLKATLGFEHLAGQGWRRSGYGALALASWKPADGWALHGNLGTASDRASGRTPLSTTWPWPGSPATARCSLPRRWATAGAASSAAPSPASAAATGWPRNGWAWT